MPTLGFPLSSPFANQGITSLGLIRDTIRQRADMVGSEFITDDEFNGWINSSYLELYDLLLAAYGSDYFVAAKSEVTTDGESELYPLPQDFYKLLGVDLSMPGNPEFRYTLKPFAFGERNKFSNPAVPSVRLGGALRYRLQGNNLWLRPLPSAGQTVGIWYAPRLTILGGDTETADLVSGWEEYIVVDCIIKAKLKEESDCQAEMALKDALFKRIQDMSQDRDMGSPATVVDTQRNSSDMPRAWGQYGDGDF